MRKEKKFPVPQEQTDSVRQQIILEGENTVRDLSIAVHIPEKDVYEHLEHIKKSINNLKLNLIIKPAKCNHCGFLFTKRERFKKPGKCPLCRSEQIGGPRFEIEEV